MRVGRRFVVTGRVQGVGFRYEMQREARKHGVAGWVRNRNDGSVEAVIQGEQDAVEAVIAWARHGPRSARVTDVQVTKTSGEFSGFETRATE